MSAIDEASQLSPGPARDPGLRLELRRPWSLLSVPLVLLLLTLIEGYRRFISPALRPGCRFLPTCSEYAQLSLRKDGLIKGVAKSGWRLARCHPFCRGGYHDPP